jgi:CBS domain-containing protein
MSSTEALMNVRKWLESTEARSVVTGSISVAASALVSEPKVTTAKTSACVRDVIRAMLEQHIHAVPVMQEEAVVEVLTLSDVVAGEN